MRRSPSSTWQRVSRRRPCPVCQKPDWCLFTGGDDAPTAAICARVESDRRAGEAGWVHRLRDDGPVWTPTRRLVCAAVSGRLDLDGSMERLAEQCRQAARPEAGDVVPTSTSSTEATL